MRRTAALFLTALSVSSLTASGSRLQLSGWAEIPSTYRHPGPVSGQFAGPANGVTPPYTGQPIPGFSGVIPSSRPGSFVALPDNGFGSQTNSADFVLGFYEVTPHFKSVGDGTSSRGPVTIESFTPFSDPQGLLDASDVTDGPVYARATYYATSPIPVDPAIRNQRLLTGADFDVESIARMDDGTFWVGEEFGPYLLHFSAQGELLRRPVRHPILHAPQNPQNTPAHLANLPSSRGFESMSRNGAGTRLYVTTEASIDSEPDKRLLQIFEFDTIRERYTGRTFTYAKDSSDFVSGGVDNVTNVFVTGDMTHVAGDRYVVIERDDRQGPPTAANPPRQKKLYLIDLGVVDRETGRLAKRLLVGLDNNYPGGNGRTPGTPDGTEIITLRSPRPRHALRVEPCRGKADNRLEAANGGRPDCR